MAEVLIGLCGCLRVEEIFMTSLTSMLRFWEETIIHPNIGDVMVINVLQERVSRRREREDGHLPRN